MIQMVAYVNLQIISASFGGRTWRSNEIIFKNNKTVYIELLLL